MAGGGTARGKWRRWGRRALLCIIVLLATGAIAVEILLSSLDKEWLKPRLQAYLRTSVGVDLDYRSARLRLLSGLRIDDLNVRTPALVRVGSAEAGWSLRSLFGTGPMLTKLALRDVELTLEQDTAAVIAPPVPGLPPSPPPPPVPTSRQLAALLKNAAYLERLSLERFTVINRLREGTTIREEWRASGIGLQALIDRADVGWRVRAQGGGATSPLELTLAHAQNGKAVGDATIRLWLNTSATDREALLTLDLQVMNQTLWPTMKVNRLVHLDARFLPAVGSSQVTLSCTELADGAGSLFAQIELPDAPQAPPLLHSARGAFELTRLLQILPPALVPVRARAAALRFDVAELVLAKLPRLASGGHAHAEATLQDLDARLAAAHLEVQKGQLTLNATPTADGALAVQLSAPLQGLRFTEPNHSLTATAIELAANGRRDRQGAVTGDLLFHVGTTERTGADRIAAHDAGMRLRVDGFNFDPAAPLAARGKFELNGEMSALSFVRPSLRAEVLGGKWTARGQLSGSAPYAVELSLPIDRLQLFGARGQPLINGRVRFDVKLADVFPDNDHPQKSRARAKLALELGDARAELSIDKAADSAAFEASLATASLTAVRAFLAGDESFTAPWEQIGLSLRSKGRVEQFESETPRIEHRTELVLSRPSVTTSGVTVAAKDLTLTASSKGTARQHEGEVDLQAQGLLVGNRALDDAHLTLAFGGDLGAPKLQLRIGADAKAGPDAKIAATLGFDRARRVVDYDFDVHLARLSPLRPLTATVRALQGFRLTGLELAMNGRGTVAGLIDKVGPNGTPHFVPHPLATLAVGGHLELTAAGLHWKDGDRDVTTPTLTWRADLRSDGARRSVRGDMSFDALHIALGERQIDVARATDLLELSVTGDLTQGEGEVSHELRLGALRQNILPGYAVGDVKFTLQATRSREGVVRVSQLDLENPAAGTVLKLNGGLDFGDERRSLSLRGTLDQDLAHLWSVREQYEGRGSSSLTLRVESGNLSLYRVQASIRVKDGSVRLPQRGYGIESFDGEVPVSVDLLIDHAGPQLLRATARNAYTELRFTDQHPLLNQHSFISVARVVTPFITVGPLAGNLNIENNIISLGQLEMGILGGRLTGQCLLDWGEKDAAIMLHVRASNLHASTGERFDGNTAVMISARERSIDGRAEILRIGRRHLLDLLDLHDPRHTDAAVNRVRGALAFGYPDHVRLSFDHGFAAVRIDMGGLARMVRIDELRGIPMGPIIDRVIAQPSGSEKKEP